jgi:hypothetical protein
VENVLKIAGLTLEAMSLGDDRVGVFVSNGKKDCHSSFECAANGGFWSGNDMPLTPRELKALEGPLVEAWLVAVGY